MGARRGRGTLAPGMGLLEREDALEPGVGRQGTWGWGDKGLGGGATRDLGAGRRRGTRAILWDFEGQVPAGAPNVATPASLREGNRWSRGGCGEVAPLR